MKYHITEGNGYTPNASKCFKGARMVAERKQKQEVGYCEIEYSDFDNAEAIDGARFDDANFLRHFER